MQWLEFKSEHETCFASLIDRATVGSAESSTIRISAKNIASLSGQFAFETGKIYYKNFADRKVVQVDQFSTLMIAHYQVRAISQLEIWQNYGEELLQSFRAILKEAQGMGVDEILTELRKRKFFGQVLPQEIESRLRKEVNDISLSSPVETLLSRPSVTDILISSHDDIWVEDGGELQKSNMSFSSADTYRVYLENLLARTEKTVDDDRPFVDFNLPDGSRGHLIAPPLTDGTYQLSIRKIRKDFFKIDDLVQLKMFSTSIANELRSAIQRRANVLISGATGSGKTTLVRALMAEVSAGQRILTIEDTPELHFQRSNTIFLCSRYDFHNAARTIDLRQLVRQALRMRPDRIVVGEVRGEEAMDLLHAMNTGHRGCIGSLHANSARDALDRLQGLVQMSSARLSEHSVRDLIGRNIQLIIHCAKNSAGQRRIEHLAFVRGVDEGRILLEVRE